MKSLRETYNNLPNRTWLGGIVLVLVIVAAIFAFAVKSKNNSTSQETVKPVCNTFTIRENGTEQCMVFETAISEEALLKGLSGRDKMDTNRGMIFVFNNDTPRPCMWMKDMKFSLDMVWLDENKKVTDIKRDLIPATYPNDFCANGKYVIEVNSGIADQAGLKIGQQLNL